MGGGGGGGGGEPYVALSLLPTIKNTNLSIRLVYCPYSFLTNSLKTFLATTAILYIFLIPVVNNPKIQPLPGQT